MVDNPGTDPLALEQAAPKPKSAIATFLTSSSGKLIMGGILLFVVLVAVGILAFFFLLNSGSQNAVVIVPPNQGTSTSTTVTVTPSNPPEQPLDETFTFRNIFAPTVKPPSTASSSSSSSSSSDTSSTTSGQEDTLILKSIHLESGVYVATFEWNGKEYECVEGEQVADSPWKVVTIYSDSVVMLYGDTRVTLEVGQGFSDGGVISK
jgi:hypothetical protein